MHGVLPTGDDTLYKDLVKVGVLFFLSMIKLYDIQERYSGIPRVHYHITEQREQNSSDTSQHWHGSRIALDGFKTSTGLCTPVLQS